MSQERLVVLGPQMPQDVDILDHSLAPFPRQNAERRALRLDAFIRQQQVGEPQGQTIDQQRAVDGGFSQDDRCHFKRRLEGMPEGALPDFVPSGAMRRDAGGHFGIARFGGRAIGALRRRRLDQAFGVTALARAGAAQHQRHGREGLRLSAGDAGP